MDRPNAEAPSATPQGQDAAGGAKRLRIVTRCGTAEEFFATFGPFADESSLFIVTNKPRPLGLRQPFLIQLRGGETILKGDVEVIESITDGSGPDGRNGMRLKLLQMDAATRDVLRRLVVYGKAQGQSIMPPAGEEAPPSVGVVPPAMRSGRTPLPPTPRPPAPRPPSPSQSAITAERPAVAASLAAARPAEERAPGAAYQLPANPFEGVTAEALESFIECTLYEERVPRGEGTDPADASNIAAAGTSAAVAGEAPSFGVIPPPPPALAPAFSAPVQAPTFGAPPAPPGAPSRESPPIRDALIAAALQAASVPKPEPQRRPWIIGVAVTAVVSSLASLIAAYFFWGRAPSDSSGSGQTSALVSGSPSVEHSAAAVTAVPSQTASAVPSAAPSSPPPARDCLVNIRSYPLGAQVRWNGDSLGNTPLADAPVPCGPAKITFELQGYETGQRTSVATLGKSGGVFLRLVPVRVAVEVTSTPTGAQISVDGRPMGRTPATITVVGLRETRVMLKHPAYKPWVQTLTPEPPKVTLHADLESK